MEKTISPCSLLRTKITDLLEEWQNTGLPSRSGLETEAKNLLEWKCAKGIPGIWKNDPPLMISTTLDDGMGHGLQLIHQYSAVAGLRVIFPGLLQTPEKIIAECQKHTPDILGLTVLQFDSEPLIKDIRKNIPAETRIVAGGPVFKADPDFAERAGIFFVAKNAAAFLAFLLRFKC